MSAAHMGHSVSDKARTAIGAAHSGKIVSQETRNKISESKTNPSAETREHLSAAKSGENHPWFGKHLPEETRLKISVAHTGKPKPREACAAMSESKKGIVPPNIEILKASRIGSTNSEEHKQIVRDALTGLIRSDETKQKIAENRAGICCGEENPSWKGGITPLVCKIRESPMYYKWRDAVFKRDNFADVMTGESGASHVLNAHHIVSFADILNRNNITTYEEAMGCGELWDVSNGMTLTEKNHMRLHTKVNKNEVTPE
jgi:hypothetical protein